MSRSRIPSPPSHWPDDLFVERSTKATTLALANLDVSQVKPQRLRGTAIPVSVACDMAHSVGRSYILCRWIAAEGYCPEPLQEGRSIAPACRASQSRWARGRIGGGRSLQSRLFLTQRHDSKASVVLLFMSREFLLGFEKRNKLRKLKKQEAAIKVQKEARREKMRLVWFVARASLSLTRGIEATKAKRGYYRGGKDQLACRGSRRGSACPRR